MPCWEVPEVGRVHASAAVLTDGNRWGESGYVTVEARNAHDAMTKATVLFDALGICSVGG